MNSLLQPSTVCLEVEEAAISREAEGTTSSDAIEMKQTLEIGEHTSELQSHHDLVCRLLLEKKKYTKKKKKHHDHIFRHPTAHTMMPTIR